MGEILFILMVILCVVTTYCLYQFLNKKGLYFMMILSIILGMILSNKIVNVFNFNLSIGIVPYVLLFSIIFILITKYGEKEENKIFKISLYSSILTIVLTLISCLYLQIVEDNISLNINTLFFNNYKVFLVYPIVLIFEEIFYFDLYDKIHKNYESIFVTNIIICLILSVLSSFIFNSIIYLNVLKLNSIVNLVLTDYLFKIFLTIINLPLSYTILKKVKK